MKKTITETIDKEYYQFAMYTISNRAIPSYIDGFKKVQRKVLYGMINEYKGKETKVADLGSISKFGYHHAESSAMDAVIGLAAEYNNVMPIFTAEGAFGSRIIPSAAATRYIYCALNPKFYDYFQDFDVLEYHDDVVENPEPKNYLPIIPWVLVNGISGIAVGFATNILSHEPKEISEMCLSYLKGENIDDKVLLPKFPDFHGKVYQSEEKHNKYITVGEIERISRNTWNITELPIGYTREKYYNVLTSMINKNMIQDFEDNCAKTFNFLIKVDSKQDKEIEKNPIAYFKLEKSFTENYTTIDENDKLVIFENKNDIIKKFVDYRLKKVEEQINFDIAKLSTSMNFNELKIKFITKILDGDVDLKKNSKKELMKYIQDTFDVNDSEIINKLISTPLYSMTVDAIKELEKTLKEQTVSYKKLLKTIPRDLMIERLTKI